MTDLKLAIAQLTASAETCENNAPIQEAEGNGVQAGHSRACAASYRAAILALSDPSALAHATMGRDVYDITAEVLSARKNWPPFNSAHEGLAVLLEEVDELKAHVWTNQKRRDLVGMRKEAVQVAAMALRFMGEVCDEETGRK